MRDEGTGKSVDPVQLRAKPVLTSDGAFVGNIVGIHIEAASERVVLLQVGDADENQQYLIPADGARLRNNTVTVPFAADSVTRGPRAGSGATISVGELAYVLGRYGAGTVEPGRLSITDRIDDVGDVAALHPDVRRLPPIVIIRPAASGHAESSADGSGSADG